MQFPQEITSQIADFMADDLQAADPRCFRAARALQAAWRGHTERHPPSSRCLCHYAAREFWSETNGTNVCPSCSIVWEQVAVCDTCSGFDCMCGSWGDVWDEGDILLAWHS